MSALMCKAMLPRLRSAALPCAHLVLAALVAPLLVGCGGAKTADRAFESPPPGPREGSFMRVRDVTLEAAAAPEAAPTAAASVDPAAPPPPPTGPVKTTTGAPKPTNERKGAEDEASSVFTAGADGGSSSGKHKGVHGAVVDSASGLSEAEVRTTIVQQQAAFQPCYEIGVASSSGSFSGVVTLRATIGPTGTVAAVDVVSSSTKNVRVDGCVADAVRRIQFPQKGGGAVVGIPIEFGR